MNLTLIGMSGAGKSYIGKILAQRLHLAYLDLDDAMEEEFKKSLPEILEDLGDEGFIAAESKTAIERTSGLSNLLISTGGSIIYAPEAMEHLRNISKVVYLNVPYSVIEKRVGGSNQRLGRIVGLGSRDLRELFDSRVPLYEKYAHFSVDPDSMSMEEVIHSIATFLGETESH